MAFIEFVDFQDLFINISGFELYCRLSFSWVESIPVYGSLPFPCRTKFECNNETNLRPILESFAAAGLDGAGPKKPEVQ